MEGVEKPEIVNPVLAKTFSTRKQEVGNEELTEKIISGDKVALSRAITIIESRNVKHFEKANTLISNCLPYSNKSIRIGITGVPGVGKSTFIETFGKYLTLLGKKVAVLAVDPSSSISKGSILGDKTRMEELVKDENAFIRPSASGDSLGGVARKTRETIILCEACGFDVVIVETVGVGQSETAVYGMVDFFLLLQIAGAGDELQGIKRGIMEMADAILINKADGDNVKKANLAKVEFGSALHFFPVKESGWQPKVSVCSAIKNEGIAEAWELILEYISLAKTNHFFERKREQQNLNWMMESIHEQLKLRFFSNPEITEKFEEIKEKVLRNEISPFVGANILLDLIH